MNNFQKSIKIIAIGLATLLITSIVSSILFILSFVDNNLKVYNFSETYNEVDNINIKLSTAKLLIKEGIEFKVEVDGLSNPFITSKNSERELIIREMRRTHYSKNNHLNIILYIPKDYLLKELFIDSGAGKIEINNLLTNKFILKQGVGLVRIKNSDFNNAEIDGGVGQIDINNSILNDLNLQAGIGSININSNITGNSKIKSGIGEINLHLNNEDLYQLQLIKGIGNISINKEKQVNNATYGTGINKLNIEGGIGAININFKK